MKSGVSDPSYRRNRIRDRFFASGEFKSAQKMFGEARAEVFSFSASAFSFQFLAFRPQVFFSEAVAERE